MDALGTATTAKCTLVSMRGLPLKGWVPDLYCVRKPWRTPFDPKCWKIGWDRCNWAVLRIGGEGEAKR